MPSSPGGRNSMLRSESASSLFGAVKNADKAGVQRILAGPGAGEDVVSAVDEDDDYKTPLHYARTADVARLLLDQGANMYTQDAYGRTPVHTANAEVVLVMIEKGVALDSVALNEQTARAVPFALPKQEAIVERRYNDFEPRPLARAVASSFLRSPSNALVNVMTWAAAAQREGRRMRATNVVKSDASFLLCHRLQLALAGCIAQLETVEDPVTLWSDQGELLRRTPGQKALRIAVDCDAKVLLSQPSVQRYLQREWRGLWLDRIVRESDVEKEKRADTFLSSNPLLFLLVALPKNALLLVIISLFPPLEEWAIRALGMQSRGDAAQDLLHVPAVKFGFASLCDLAFCYLFTVASPATLWLLPWAAAALWSELRDLVRGDGAMGVGQALRHEVVATLPWRHERSLYFNDMWNRLDLPAMVLATSSLSVGYYTGSEGAAAPLHAVAVLLLWLRQLRLLALSPSLGPLVYMGFKMVGDVAKWLILVTAILLAYASSFTALLRGIPAFDPAIEGGTCAELHARFSCDAVDELAKCAEAIGKLGRFGGSLRLLFEESLNGDHFFDCQELVPNGTLLLVLAYSEMVVVVILMVNMLIALMAKTFDNVWEALGVNSQYLFAQLVLSWNSQVAVPPPLLLLTIPYELLELLRTLGYCVTCRGASDGYRRLDRSSHAVHLGSDAKSFEAIQNTLQGVNSWQYWKARHKEEDLADSAAVWIENREDDNVQEDRWRTKMMQRQAQLVRQLETRIDDRFDEIKQLLGGGGTVGSRGLPKAKAGYKSDFDA